LGRALNRRTVEAIDDFWLEWGGRGKKEEDTPLEKG
jgi:hypothetical protein